MKKILAAVVLIAACITSVFAYNHNFGLGFSMPISTFNTEAKGTNVKEDISQLGYGGHAFYMGNFGTGFTFKVSEAFGLSTTKDIIVTLPVSQVTSKAEYGIFSNFNAGIGWTFINSERATLSLLGMLGFSVYAYPKSEDYTVGTVKHEASYTAGIVTLDLGGDLYFSYRLGEHFGLFCNVAGRYIAVGSAIGSVTDEWKEGGSTKSINESYEVGTIHGKFLIQPTVGISWKF